MNITIEIKSVYGRDLIYPACEISRQFAALVDHKTLTRSQLEIIKKIGYGVEIKRPDLSTS